MVGVDALLAALNGDPPLRSIQVIRDLFTHGVGRLAPTLETLSLDAFRHLYKEARQVDGLPTRPKYPTKMFVKDLREWWTECLTEIQSEPNLLLEAQTRVTHSKVEPHKTPVLGYLKAHALRDARATQSSTPAGKPTGLQHARRELTHSTEYRGLRVQGVRAHSYLLVVNPGDAAQPTQKQTGTFRRLGVLTASSAVSAVAAVSGGAAAACWCLQFTPLACVCLYVCVCCVCGRVRMYVCAYVCVCVVRVYVCVCGVPACARSRLYLWHR